MKLGRKKEKRRREEEGPVTEIDLTNNSVNHFVRNSKYYLKKDLPRSVVLKGLGRILHMCFLHSRREGFLLPWPPFLVLLITEEEEEDEAFKEYYWGKEGFLWVVPRGGKEGN